jgi:hypothetical protein
VIEQMTRIAPEISEEDLRLLEAEIPVTFPHDYRLFLLQYNGGRPEPNAYPLQGLAKNPFGVIQIFFGIDTRVESSSLLWNYRVMEGRIPPNLFPIARDDGGDLLCLSLYGDDAGSVVFWDYYAEHYPPTYNNVYRIPGADSFSAFIELLQPFPDDSNG